MVGAAAVSGSIGSTPRALSAVTDGAEIHRPKCQIVQAALRRLLAPGDEVDVADSPTLLWLNKLDCKPA